MKPTNRSICLSCIGDTDLRQQLRSIATNVPCKFCHERALGVSLKTLATSVDGTLRLVLRPGEFSPSFVSDSDKVTFEQQGEDLGFWLQTLLEIGDEPAREVLAWLIEIDPFDPRDGGEPYYDEDALYERERLGDWKFRELWMHFSEVLKHEQRFFGRETIDQLSEILGKRGSLEAADLPVFLLGSGERIAKLFRARRAASVDDARHFLSAPESELWAPPPGKATSGRMNPAGIAVFYAATSRAVAVAEVRPSVGGFVVVGSFSPTRTLRLLDLTRLGGGLRGSVFSANYPERKARSVFLAGFQDLVTQPVQPQDEPLEHISTQAVAEYVKNELQFDGILYRSVQQGGRVVEGNDDEDEVPAHENPESLNVVLFGGVRRHVRADYVRGYDTPNTSSEYPIAYDSHSAHCVWVTGVSYSASRVDVSDERGDPEGYVDAPF